MILAEQTAMQASTMGSSLMFSRQTWRPERSSLTKQGSFRTPGPRGSEQGPGQGPGRGPHLSDVSVTVAHPDFAAAVRSTVAGRRTGKLQTDNNLGYNVCGPVHVSPHEDGWFYLHSTACLHYRNGLQELRVPLVLVHGYGTHINHFNNHPWVTTTTINKLIY